MITIETIKSAENAIRYDSNTLRLYRLSNEAYVYGKADLFEIGDKVVYFAPGTVIEVQHLHGPLDGPGRRQNSPVDYMFVPMPDKYAYVVGNFSIGGIFSQGFIFPLTRPCYPCAVDTDVEENTWIADWTKEGCFPSTEIGTNVSELFYAEA